jgi:prevent-host-death family protein
MRDFTHNTSYYVDMAQTQPVMITKHGVEVAALVPPSVVKKTPKPKTKSLADLAFFKDFVEPEEWKGQSSADIADELRRRAWGHDE